MGRQRRQRVIAELRSAAGQQNGIRQRRHPDMRDERRAAPARDLRHDLLLREQRRAVEQAALAAAAADIEPGEPLSQNPVGERGLPVRREGSVRVEAGHQRGVHS